MMMSERVRQNMAQNCRDGTSLWVDTSHSYMTASQLAESIIKAIRKYINVCTSMLHLPRAMCIRKPYLLGYRPTPEHISMPLIT